LWQLKTFAHWGGTQSCTPTKYLLQNWGVCNRIKFVIVPPNKTFSRDIF
jgi:hypothetical protein